MSNKKNIILIITLLMITNLALAAKQTKSIIAPVIVNVVKAKGVEWQPKIESTGTLVAYQGITVKADISGRVTQVYFKSGQYVEKGEPLIQIYPNILEAQLKANEALLKLSKVTYKRYADLYKKQAISSSDYDTASANLNKDQAAVEETQAELKQTLITAPFSGYLGIRKVNLGDYVSAGQAIVNLEDTNPIYVDFPVPEVYSKKVKVGQKITVNSQANDHKAFTGEVSALESLINSSTRTLEVRASIPNKDNSLIPGSFRVVDIYVGEQRQVISIPQTALVYSDKGVYVYKVENNKAIQTYVSLGIRGDSNVYINKGLKAGDIVVSAGQQKLFNGATVQLANQP